MTTTTLDRREVEVKGYAPRFFLRSADGNPKSPFRSPPDSSERATFPYSQQCRDGVAPAFALLHCGTPHLPRSAITIGIARHSN
jgi:hypothetical protein